MVIKTKGKLQRDLPTVEQTTTDMEQESTENDSKRSNSKEKEESG